jgi:GH15 family glucan-1,4-alpha-glucosidase
LDEAIPYLEWTNWRASSSGVLAEQYHPYTGAQISVSPLTWSHATLITTSMQYRLRHAEFSGAHVPLTQHASIDGASA